MLKVLLDKTELKYVSLDGSDDTAERKLHLMQRRNTDADITAFGPRNGIGG
jgi:hypothetical protein